MTNLIEPQYKYGILHNRKTAGTALKYIIEQQKKRNAFLPVICLGHAITFPQFIKKFPDANAIFFVRDPISKFVSGFYSRLRQGKPRYDFPWNSAEAKAFARFQTPNELGEALSSYFFRGHFAKKAMQSIAHIKHTLIDFLGPISFLREQINRIAYIGHQPDFEYDLKNLRSLLMLDEDILAPQDDITAHRNPQHVDKSLSETAIKNLKKWYQTDIEIYQWCLEQRQQIFAGMRVQ